MLNFSFKNIVPLCYFCKHPIKELPEELSYFESKRLRQGYERNQEAYYTASSSVFNKLRVCKTKWSKLSQKPFRTFIRLHAWLKMQFEHVRIKQFRKLNKKYDLNLNQDFFKKKEIERKKKNAVIQNVQKENKKLAVRDFEMFSVSDDVYKTHLHRESKLNFRVPGDLYNVTVEQTRTVQPVIKNDKLSQLTDNDLYTMYRFFCITRKSKFKKQFEEEGLFKDFLYLRKTVPKRKYNIFYFLRHIRKLPDYLLGNKKFLLTKNFESKLKFFKIKIDTSTGFVKRRPNTSKLTPIENYSDDALEDIKAILKNRKKDRKKYFKYHAENPYFEPKIVYCDKQILEDMSYRGHYYLRNVKNVAQLSDILERPNSSLLNLIFEGWEFPDDCSELFNEKLIFEEEEEPNQILFDSSDY
jgi:hypothetical protein